MWRAVTLDFMVTTDDTPQVSQRTNYSHGLQPELHSKPD